jgi:hypothetical protein
MTSEQKGKLRVIKVSDIPEYRRMFATKQEYKCALCEGPLAGSTICLDHDHKTGHVRAALCGTCNRAEGKVLKAASYMAKQGHLSRTNVLKWLFKMIKYIDYYNKNPTGIIHPSFDLKTGKQKPVRRKKKKVK